ncbi:MAG: COG1470 family protein [Thermoplasmatota archaeon]
MKRTAVLALALLATGLGLPLHADEAAAQGVGPDLAATGLVITGPVPGWTNGVGNSTTLEATVTNRGSAPAMYEISYLWVDAQGAETPLNGAEESSFDVSRQPLASGASRVHQAPWRLQAGQEGNGSVRMRIAVSQLDGQGPSDPDPSNDARSLAVFVPTRGLTFSVVDRPAVAEPGVPGFFRLLLRNVGNAPLPVSLRVAQAPADARLQPTFDPPTLVLAPRSQANATLYIAFVAGGDFSPFNATFLVEADPGFLPRPAVRTPWVTNGSADASLDGYSFTLGHPSTGNLVVLPNEWTNATVLVTNTGSRPDSYALEPSMAEGAWDLVTVPPTPSRVALYPGETFAATLRMRPPSSVAAGTVVDVHVTATARVLPQPVVLAVPAIVPGAQLALVSLGLQDPVPYSGDAPTALITLLNRGEESSRAGAVLRVSATLAGSPPSHTDVFLPGLAPGEQVVQSVGLSQLPRGGALTLQATLHTVEGATPTPVSASALVHDALLGVVAPTALSGSPGETVSYRAQPAAFRLVNVGAMVETLTLNVTSDGGRAALDVPTITLAPGQARTIGVRQTLPAAANGTLVNLTLTASLESRADRSWSARVATLVIDREAPRLAFPAGTPSEWALGTPLTLVLSADDAGGNATPTLTVADPSGSAPRAVPLQDAGNATWRAILTFATAGNHTFAATATDASGNTANLTRIVRAAEVEPPLLLLESALPETLAPKGIVRILVEDERAVERLILEIRQEGAGAPIRREVPVAGGVAQFDLTGASEGPAELVLEATNAAGATSTLTLQVVVAPAPEPAGAAGATGRDAGSAHALAAGALALALSIALRRRRGGLP